MDRLFIGLATWFGAGYLPKAPGTWGSLAALPLYLFLRHLNLENYLLALGLIFLVAVISAGQAEKILDRKDPGVVVIDEVLGMLITLIAAPDNPVIWLAGFFIFRFFDILKPWPIRLADRRINGGLGIVLDDVLAGIYSFISLQVFCYAVGR